MRELPHLNEKNKEKPLCYPYSVKARALLHAHFSRLELPMKTLEVGKSFLTISKLFVKILRVKENAEKISFGVSSSLLSIILAEKFTSRDIMQSEMCTCDLLLISDKQYVVKKCPYLINEMVNIVAQLVALAHGGRGELILCH